METLPRWYILARQEIGTREISGPEHNPRVLAYFQIAGHGYIHDDETAWCAAFVSAMLELAGEQSARTVRARDYLNWGVAVTQPRVGDIVVFRRGNNEYQGHVGFFERREGDKICVLGGNQNNQVCRAWYSQDDLLGFRRPMVKYGEELQPLPTSTPPPLPAVAPDLPVFLQRPEPKLPVYEYETRDAIEERLRQAGSRTMANADKTEARSRLIAWGGLGSIIASIMSAFTDMYNAMYPLVPIIGLGLLGTLALGFAIFSVIDQKRIKQARVEDHLNGLHCGAGGCEIGKTN